MGEVAVKFLGEEYQVPETIKEFLEIDELLSPLRLKVTEKITSDINKLSKVKFGRYVETYIKKMLPNFNN